MLPILQGSMPGSQRFCGAKPIFFRRPFRTAPALPKFISECGDNFLRSLVSDCLRDTLGPGSLMLRLCQQVSLIGVLEALPGAFMSGQVIFFSMVLGAAAMSVSGKVTMLGGYLL